MFLVLVQCTLQSSYSKYREGEGLCCVSVCIYKSRNIKVGGQTLNLKTYIFLNQAVHTKKPQRKR